MEGTTHGLVGAAAGLAVGLTVGRLIGMDTAPELASITAFGAGAAFIPDGDTPKSRAATFLGPISGLISWCLRWTSVFVMWATRTKADPKPHQHRGLIHTTFAAFLFAIAAAFTWGAPPIAVILLVSAVCYLGIGEWCIPVLISMAIVKHDLHALVDDTQLIWPLVLFVGYVVGGLWPDSLTVSGVYRGFPFKKNGQRWRKNTKPRIRLRTGGWAEKWLFVPAISCLFVAEILLYTGTDMPF
jgi:membrane-bound metal-dependent hydrolase YbcI (DUF457 family)